jgi:hypothetical protein
VNPIVEKSPNAESDFTPALQVPDLGTEKFAFSTLLPGALCGCRSAGPGRD